MFFDSDTMGDYVWDGDPFAYINEIRRLWGTTSSPAAAPQQPRTPYDACVNALPGRVDLYGDCDYLYAYPATGVIVTNTQPPTATTPPPNTPTKSVFKEFEEWLAKGNNKTIAMIGGLALVLVLTRK